MIHLRGADVTDVDTLYRFFSDEEVMRWGTGGRGDTFFTRTQLEEKIGSQTAGGPARLFVMELVEPGEPPTVIGTVGFRDLDTVQRRVTIGMSIGVKEHWGKGYGTEALQQFVHLLFTRYNLHRIDLDTFADNKRAIRCYEKCGFVVEGVLRKAAWTLDGYCDQVLMGLLREDWEANR